MKITFKLTCVIAIILISTSACKKISAPNDDSKKIFGSWTYDLNFGGFSGSDGSTRFKAGSWVKCTEQGYFKIYNGSSKESQKRFTIEMKKSIYDIELRPALIYKNGDYETYLIVNDTLYLSDEAYDGYTYRFIKK